MTLGLPTGLSAKKNPTPTQIAPASEASQADRSSVTATADLRDRDDPRARAKYLETRRSGGQPIPRGARLRAMRQQHQMMVNEGKAFWDGTPVAPVAGVSVERTGAAGQRHLSTPESGSMPPPLSSTQWVFIGPQPTNPNPINPGGGNHFSGRVTALAVDPSDSTGNTVYLGGAQGGVWKTTDGGVNWNALTDNQASLAIGSIVLDPQLDPVPDSNGVHWHDVYVGTGEENFGLDSYYGIGILKSTDGGSTWNVIGPASFFNGASPADSDPECDAITHGNTGFASGCGGLKIGSLAATNGVLLAAAQGAFSTSGGLYRSTNGGVRWDLVSGIGAGTSSTTRYTADSVVFVGTTLVAFAGIDGQGIFKSTDGGATWIALNSGVTLSNTGRVSLSAANDGTVYAALERSSDSTLSGLYKLAPAGTTWTQLSVTDFCGGSNSTQCFYDMLVAVDPNNSNVVFVGGSGFPNTTFLFHSINGGASWIQDTANIHADQHAGAFSPDSSTFYIGNDGGAYKATGIGASSVTWTELNATLGLTQFYSYFVIDPNNSQMTYAGTQDNGSQRFSGDMTWDDITCGDGAGAVIDSTTGRVFANCNFIDVRESDTGAPGSFGDSTGSVVAGINQNDTVAFIPPMIGDNSNPQRLYFGTNKVYEAQSNEFLSWSAISGVLTNGGTDPFEDYISNMDVSVDGSTMYVVTGDGQVSKGTGLLTATPSFTNVTGSGQFPSGAYLSAVRISPADSDTAYIVLPGFSAGNHIYKTTSGGINWTNITGNLPNTPVNDLVIDPDLPGTLYAATDVGVFVTTNDGVTWTTLQTLLPNVAVLGLRLHRASRTLRAATHGRGMWDLFVPSCGTGPCPLFSPQGLNFGDQAVGTSSTAKILTLTNTGTAALSVFAFTPSGDFSQTNNCPATLAQNASCTIAVTFTPQQGLQRNGSISLTSNVGHATIAGLTGTGIVVPANDNVNSSITIGSLPFTATVITNGATTGTNPADPVPPAANAVEDGTIKNCVGGYAPNSLGLGPVINQGYDPSPSVNHHSIWFTYVPGVTGTINVDTLQSSGIDTVLSIWTVSGNSYSFVPNSCDDDSVDGTGNPVKQSKLVNFPVTAGTTYHIMVTGYYPSDFGAIVFHMTGPVPAFNMTPAALTFNAMIGRTSTPQSVTIQNASGVSQTISNLNVSSPYSVSNNCPGSLANNASCNATVTFIPTVAGQQNGFLALDANGVLQTIPLMGTGFNLSLNQRRLARSTRSGTGVVQGQVERFELSLDTSTGDVAIPVTLDCADVPPGAKCTVSPSQINATNGSVPFTVTLQTSASSAKVTTQRTRRLGASTPVGNYNLRVVARAGGAETTTVIPISVTAAARSTRLAAIQP